jgi:murein DD-endopeptidase MepM/ murein hydrolase activator NlpD
VFIEFLAIPPHTEIAMSDITSNPLAAYRAINNLNLLEKTGSTTTATSSADSSDSLKDTFQQMLMMTMLSGMSSSSSEGSSSSSAMMMPLMLSLLEKLISDQVDQNSTDKSTATAIKATATAATNVKDDTNTSRIVPTSQPSGRPLAGGTLTQGYHTGHYALDFGTPVGTEVKATMDGKVVYAGWNNEGYGNLVIVENGPYRTYYAHLSEIPVTMGQSVSAGNTVGLSGNTGNSTGPHLHYEVRYQGNHIDPTSFTLNG